MKTKTLGIDPGPETSACVILEGDKIIYRGEHENSNFIRWISLWSHRYDHIAIEGIVSHGHAVGKSVFDTCIMIGQIVGAEKIISDFKSEIKIYTRPTIKAHISGHATATKKQVNDVLKEIYGKPRKGSQTQGFNLHLWDALATAHYHKEGLKMGGWGK